MSETGIKKTDVEGESGESNKNSIGTLSRKFMAGIGLMAEEKTEESKEPEKTEPEEKKEEKSEKKEEDALTVEKVQELIADALKGIKPEGIDPATKAPVHSLRQIEEQARRIVEEKSKQLAENEEIKMLKQQLAELKKAPERAPKHIRKITKFMWGDGEPK